MAEPYPHRVIVQRWLIFYAQTGITPAEGRTGNTTPHTIPDLLSSVGSQLNSPVHTTPGALLGGPPSTAHDGVAHDGSTLQ